MKNDKWKLIRIKIKGLIRNALSKFSLSYFIFALSLVFFFAALLPSLNQKLPFYDILYEMGSFPGKYSLEGTINIATINDFGEVIYLPAVNALIYSGGFSTRTDNNGWFNLTFVSISHESIPIVVDYDEQFHIFWVNYPDKRYNYTQEFIINDNT